MSVSRALAFSCGFLVLAACGGSSGDDGSSVGTFTVATFKTIPGVGTGPGAAAPYPSTLEVTGMKSTTSKVIATLSGLSHTNPDDLEILLVAPDGRACQLMGDMGDTLDIVGVTLTFD